MIIIYGKMNCPQCMFAKQYCQANGLEFQYKLVGQDITKEQLEEMAGMQLRSVPQIFLKEDGFFEYIGGVDQLKERMEK